MNNGSDNLPFLQHSGPHETHQGQGGGSFRLRQAFKELEFYSLKAIYDLMQFKQMANVIANHMTDDLTDMGRQGLCSRFI